nr:collagen-like protein [Heyndrickxia oleronia]
MPRFPYKELDVELGRKFRSDMNQNFKDIEADIKELNGGQLEAVEAAHEAQAQAGYAQDAGDYANERGLYASEQGDYAKTQADKVKQSVENLGNLEQRIEVEIENSQTQSAYAKEQADRLKETNDHFKSVGDYDPLVTYYPYNIVEYNGSSYICITVSTGNLPTDTTYFNLFASKGEKGDRGDTGERGLQGIQGEQGLKGEKGDPGESFIWKGEYNPSKTYVVNDTVGYNGSSYICIKNTTIGILPTDTNYFNLLSQRGIDGSGSIVTINGKSPDLNGNVQLDANEIGAILSSEKGVAGGVAKLDENGQVVDANNNPVSGAVESVNGQTGKVNLDIPSKTSQLTNDSNYETTMGSQSKADSALQSAKDYTDQVAATIPKRTHYPYLLKATSDNQTEFTIPLSTFDKTKDSLQVVQNTIFLNELEHYSVTGTTITLNNGVITGTSLFISIVENMYA